MSDDKKIIDFKEAQAKHKEIMDSVLKPIIDDTKTPFEEGHLVDSTWGALDDLITSGWVNCNSCHARTKLVMETSKFITIIGQVIMHAHKHDCHPIALFYQDCNICGHKNGFTITNINITACQTMEDGTPWPPAGEI